MIGSWMLYAVAVSALFTIAAHALERVVAARGRPRRMLWVVAMTPLGRMARCHGLASSHGG